MIKQYFKQSLVLLQQNKLLSVIAIIGTALAIAMIMCIVLIYQARTANYEPEINRDRTLSIEMTIAQKIDDKGWNMGNQLSLRTIKECFYPMTTAEGDEAHNFIVVVEDNFGNSFELEFDFNNRNVKDDGLTIVP
ncbi:hypothetical protein ACIXQX_17445, partial [Bacteroides fragilis]